MTDVVTKKKSLFTRWWFWLGAIVIIVVIAASGGKKSEAESGGANDAKMTKAEFDQISTGMTLDQVSKIVGSEGTVASEAGDGEYKAVMRTWEGEGSLGANANVMFQGGKVQSKAQMGLE